MLINYVIGLYIFYMVFYRKGIVICNDGCCFEYKFCIFFVFYKVFILQKVTKHCGKQQILIYLT